MKEILYFEVLIALSVAKINDWKWFKDNFSNQSSTYRPKKKKVEYYGIHIETVKRNGYME